MKESAKTQSKPSPSEIIINLFIELNKLLKEYIESSEPGLSLRSFIRGASPHSMSYNLIDFRIQSIYQKIKILDFQDKFKIQNSDKFLTFCDLFKHKKFIDLNKSLKSKNIDIELVFLSEIENKEITPKNPSSLVILPVNQVKKLRSIYETTFFEDTILLIKEINILLETYINQKSNKKNSNSPYASIIISEKIENIYLKISKIKLDDQLEIRCRKSYRKFYFLYTKISLGEFSISLNENIEFDDPILLQNGESIRKIKEQEKTKNIELFNRKEEIEIIKDIFDEQLEMQNLSKLSILSLIKEHEKNIYIYHHIKKKLKLEKNLIKLQILTKELENLNIKDISEYEIELEVLKKRNSAHRSRKTNLFGTPIRDPKYRRFRN